MKPVRLLPLFFLLSTYALAQDGLQSFLNPLGQNSLDSTTVLERHHRNGALKEKTVTMHSHYYAFGIKKEKFLRKTFIKITKHYGKTGILEKCDSLAPPEQGSFYEKYYSADGRIVRFASYKSKNKRFDVNTMLPPPGFVKIKESVDHNGKETVVYELNEPVKYLVNRNGAHYRFTSKLYEEDLIHQVNAKYATFEAGKNYMEVRINDASSDSILCTLKFHYSNSLLNTTEPTAVRMFIVESTSVFIEVPRLLFFDKKKPDETFILDYNFKKIIKASLRETLVLKPRSRDDYYFWICNDKCGLYDLNGKNIIPPTHDVVYGNGGDFLKITTDKLHACFDYRGNIVIPYSDDYDAFTLSDANMAQIYNSSYSDGANGVSYVNLVTRDTIKVASGLPFYGNFAVAGERRKMGVIDTKGNWIVKPHERITNVEISPDSLLFIELENPRFYHLAGNDRKYWHQKYVLRLPDSLQNKTDLLTRHPDFDPRENIYVLYNVKTKKTDTLNVKAKALDGIQSYSLSIESNDNRFVNGYAKLKISGHGSTLNWFYTFLSRDGSVVSVQKQYDEVKEMGPKGLAIVKDKVTVNGSNRKEFQGVIATNGEEIVPCRFASCNETKYGYIVLSHDGWGFFNFDGEMVIKPEKDYNAVQERIKSSVNPFRETSMFD